MIVSKNKTDFKQKEKIFKKTDADSKGVFSVPVETGKRENSDFGRKSVLILRPGGGFYCLPTHQTNFPFLHKFSYNRPKALLVIVSHYEDGTRSFFVSKTGECCKNASEALKKAFFAEKVRTVSFYKCLSRTLEYLRIILPPKEFFLLDLLLADYKKFPLGFADGIREKPYFAPRKSVPLFDEILQKTILCQVGGADILLQERLERLGAFYHLRSIRNCSTSAVFLRNDETGQVAAYNKPCRRANCIYCSNLVKDERIEPVYRSQSNTERAKKHYRYFPIGGEVSHFGRLVLTLPKSVEKKIDRADIRDMERRRNFGIALEKLEGEIVVLQKKIDGLSEGNDDEKARLEDKKMAINFESRCLRSALSDLKEYGSTKVYGTKFEREIELIGQERVQLKSQIGLSEAKKKKGDERLRKQIQRKREKLEEYLKLESRVKFLTAENRRLREEKPQGFKEMARFNAQEKKGLKRELKELGGKLEEGRIVLSRVQKICAEFIEKQFGVDGALVTPHLTGEKSAAKGELHIHFHTLFIFLKEHMEKIAALQGEAKNNCPFDVSSGQPFMKKEWLEKNTGMLAMKWKACLEDRLNIRIPEKRLSNPQYEYACGSDDRDLVKLAFWSRYDHRIEAGGWRFVVMASEDEVCKVLRMTVKQRYTRGYGKLSDRNLQEYMEEIGAPSLRQVMEEKGDLKVIEGEWQAITETMLREDIPFIKKGEKESKQMEMKFDEEENELSLPVEVELKETPVSVNFVPRVSEREKEFYPRSFIYRHEKYSVSSVWSIEDDESIVLRRVLGVLPGVSKQEVSGFYVWNQDLRVAVKVKMEEIRDRIEGKIGKLDTS